MNPPNNLTDLIFIFIDLIQTAMPVLVALALAAFLKGLVSFIAKAGDSKSHEEGRNLMVWGLIALFIMISFLGIIQLLRADLGFTGFGLPLLPE